MHRILAAGSSAVLVLTRASLVETLRLRRGREEIVLDVVNAGLADVRLIRPEILNHENALGEPDRSTLFLPTGPVRGVVVAGYPGAIDTGGWYGPLPLTYNIRPAVLAGAGYAVITPAIPYDRSGTTSGDFFRASIDRAVDAAFLAHPELPRDRTAIFGHSMGGYVALSVAARSKRYQSYVVSSAPTDLFASWGEFTGNARILPETLPFRFQQGWVENGQVALGAMPWEDPAAYVRDSPWLAADRITAPVLLLTADMDFVPLSGSERVFSALARLGGRARLVTYWGEHHARWSPANIRDQYAQVFNWLEETLAARPAGSPTPEPRPRTPPPPAERHSGPAR